MGFREGETDSFPFDRTDNGIWYFTVKSDEITPYKSTMTDQKDLVIELNKMLRSGRKFQLFGVWHGQYKTDIFVLDPATVRKRLEDEKAYRNMKYKQVPL
jgi:hypothetical protein